VRFRLGEIPAGLADSKIDSCLWRFAERKCLFNCPGRGRYLISRGEEILVECRPGTDPRDIRVNLLGSAWGALLHQRGLFPLHASAIATESGAVLFMGGSGSGKSTMAAALVRRGYRLLADDICAIDTRGVPTVMPGNPCLMLWQDMLGVFDLKAETLTPVRNQLKKFVVPIQTGFSPAPSPIRAIFILRDGNTPELNASRLRGFRKMEAISVNTYRRGLIGPLGLVAQHAAQLGKIAAAAPITRVSRPRHPFRLEGLVELLIGEFSG